jgi:hypothetical protein
MLTSGVKEVVKALILLIFLLVNVVAFSFSAYVDFAEYGRYTVISATLRFVIAALNFAALLRVARRLSGHAQHGQLVLPGMGRRDLWVDPVVLIAEAAAIPMLFIPIWIELKSPSTEWRPDGQLLALASVCLLFAVGLLVRALVLGHLGFGWVAVGSLLPALGFLQFAYTAFYKPAHERPRVDVEANIERVGSVNGIAYLKGVVSLKNNGEAPTEVLRAVYVMTEHRLGSPVSMSWKRARKVLDLSNSDRRHTGRFVSLLGVDDILASGDSLEPGESLSRSFVFDVRERQQDLVRLTVYISMVTPNGDSKTAKCKLPDSSPNSCSRRNFPPESWIRSKLYDGPFARTTLKLDALPNEAPYLVTKYGSRQGRTHKGVEVETIDPLVRDQVRQVITEHGLDP